MLNCVTFLSVVPNQILKQTIRLKLRRLISQTVTLNKQREILLLCLFWFVWISSRCDSCERNGLLAAAQHISQAALLWGHSACQGCCSYLSLAANDSSAGPSRSPPGARPHGAKPVACECVCGAAARLSAALCNLACRKVSVKVPSPRDDGRESERENVFAGV